MQGIELTARFGFKPNKLKYCGPEGFAQKISEFLQGKKEAGQQVKQGLEKFEVMYPYLQLVAAANGLDAFDYRVGEAYWIGNELLEKVGKEEWKKTAEKLKMPVEIKEKYVSSIRKNAVPHHSFHVLNVFGEKIALANECKASWGRVMEKTFGAFVVEHRPIVAAGGKYGFGALEQKEIEKGFAEAVVGEWVAFHWGMGCKKISLEEVKALEKYTLQNMLALNSE